MIKGLAHVAVMTTDVERAAAFWQEMLGFRETLRLETPHSGTIIFVAVDGTEVELFGGGKSREGAPGEREVGYPHLALAVDDVDVEYERLKALGVEFDMPPTDAEAGIRLAFFRDPDGNRLEIITRKAQ